MKFFKNTLTNGQGYYYCCFNGSNEKYDWLRVCTFENMAEISQFFHAKHKQSDMKEECSEQEFLKAYTDANAMLTVQYHELFSKQNNFINEQSAKAVEV